MTKRTVSGRQPERSTRPVRPTRVDQEDVPSPGPGADVLFEFTAETSLDGATKISILSQGLIHGFWLPPCMVGGVVRLLGAPIGVAVTALGVVFVVCAAF